MRQQIPRDTQPLARPEKAHIYEPNIYDQEDVAVIQSFQPHSEYRPPPHYQRQNTDRGWSTKASREKSARVQTRGRSQNIPERSPERAQQSSYYPSSDKPLRQRKPMHSGPPMFHQFLEYFSPTNTIQSRKVYQGTGRSNRRKRQEYYPEYTEIVQRSRPVERPSPASLPQIHQQSHPPASVEVMIAESESDAHPHRTAGRRRHLGHEPSEAFPVSQAREDVRRIPLHDRPPPPREPRPRPRGRSPVPTVDITTPRGSICSSKSSQVSYYAPFEVSPPSSQEDLRRDDRPPLYSPSPIPTIDITTPRGSICSSRSAQTYYSAANHWHTGGELTVSRGRLTPPSVYHQSQRH
jgi:hypothetical protein